MPSKRRRLPRKRTNSRKPRPVLIIVHSPSEQPALFERIFEGQAVRSLVLRPYLGEAFPSPRELSGVVSLGGPMSAYEESEHPWITFECNFLREAFDQNLPILGICLGGQLLAKAMGGHVERAHQPEMGWHPLEINTAGKEDPIFGPISELLGSEILVYQWHQDTFHLPEGAVLLAKTAGCPRQAYRIGTRAYGLQFHPEVDAELIDIWLGEAGAEDEIRAFQKRFPNAPVQDPDVQRSQAHTAESISATFSATIGSLFQTGEKWRKMPAAVEELKTWQETRTLLKVQFKGPRVQYRLSGWILGSFDLPGGKFILFKSKDNALWPLRVRDLQRIEPASKKRSRPKSTPSPSK
ncbi:MAG: type 1 glutamine amidotransferase [Bdellovibrio sp.]|nr:type 1 glutamine amidotransferase [Bdellovibrio sp.]